MSRNRKIEKSSSFGRATSARRQVISQTAGGFPADLTRVPVEDLVGNPENRRNLGDLQELADSLKQHGLRQPVGVIPSDDFAAVFPQHKETVEGAVFVVINGNRRLAAARMAKVPTLAVHVTELADSTAVRIAVLVENIHRKNLDPLEEAEALQELVVIYGSNAEVGRQLNKSKVWVGQRLALLNLKPHLKGAVHDGSLRIKDARRLGTLPPEEQEVEWEKIVNPVYPSPSDSEAPDAGERVNPVYSPPSGSDAPQDSPKGVNPVYDEEPKEPESAGGSSSSPAKKPVDQPVQLMLNLEWEPEAAATEVVRAYGSDRAREMAEAILAQV